MTPSLPHELLSEILGWATVSEEPAERQLTRNRFRLVCRAWNDSLHYWKDIDVGTLSKLSRLMIALDLAGLKDPSGPPALAVRSLGVQLAGALWAQSDGTAILLVCEVLRRVTGVERIEVAADQGIFASGRPEYELHPLLVQALSRLAAVRHFRLTALDKDVNHLECAVIQLDR